MLIIYQMFFFIESYMEESVLFEKAKKNKKHFLCCDREREKLVCRLSPATKFTFMEFHNSRAGICGDTSAHRKPCEMAFPKLKFSVIVYSTFLLCQHNSLCCTVLIMPIVFNCPYYAQNYAIIMYTALQQVYVC